MTNAPSRIRAVELDGVHPVLLLGHSKASLTFWSIVEADRELAVALEAAVDEVVGRSRCVGPHEDRVDDQVGVVAHVVARCATQRGAGRSSAASTSMWSSALFAPALPRSQLAREGLVGLVQEAAQRVEAEARPCRSATRPPCPSARRARVASMSKVTERGAAPVDHARSRATRRASMMASSPIRTPEAIRRRVRGDRTEQVGLVAQHREVAQAVPAVGQEHREVRRARHRDRVGAHAGGGRHRSRQRTRQTRPIGELGHEQRAGTAGHALAVEGHCNAVRGSTTVHL